jgi:hypothetical protein
LLLEDDDDDEGSAMARVRDKYDGCCVDRLNARLPLAVACAFALV